MGKFSLIVKYVYLFQSLNFTKQFSHSQNDAVNYLAIADNNMIATNAITGKLNEVSKIAEALDIALRETQNCLEMDNCRAHSLERKTEGNTSIDSRESTDVSPLNILHSYYYIML